MALDIRQVIAAFLTLSMLGNMIKRDHFDSIEMKLPETSSIQYGEIEVTKQSLVTLPSVSKGPWNWKEDQESLKPCWNKQTTTITERSAIKRNFKEIYDTERFVRSLDGLVNISKKQPAEVSIENLGVVKIPNVVSEDYIAAHVQPLFKTTGTLRLATHFPSINMRKIEEIKYSDTSACLAMFGTLQFQAEVQEVIDSMVKKVRTLSRKSNGQFIAVDFKVEMLKKKGCKKSGATG